MSPKRSDTSTGESMHKDYLLSALVEIKVYECEPVNVESHRVSCYVSEVMVQ